MRRLTDTEAMKFALGYDVIEWADTPYAANTILVCFDVEQFEHHPRMVTEVGLATFSRSDAREFTQNPGPHGADMLSTIYPYFCRMIDAAQFVNGTFVKGPKPDPEANRFGQTHFVTKGEMKQALEAVFTFPVDAADASKGFCPVVCLGHDVGGDFKMLKQKLDFYVEELGTVVKVIDTQTMAHEAGIPSRGNKIGLGDLCEHFDLSATNRHTALNDAMYTVIPAVQMALAGEQGEESESASLDEVVEGIEAASREVYLPIGISAFCTKCGRNGHLRGSCNSRVYCDGCAKANRRGFAKTHNTKMCPLIHKKR